LWVSISGAYALRRVDLTGDVPVPGEQLVLPEAENGDLAAAGPMVVLPGTTGSLAISLHRFNVSPSFAGVLVIDDGAPRMLTTRGHTGASRLTAGPDGYVFGYNNLHTGYGFYSIAVAADGVTQTEHSDLVNGFSTDIAYGDGYVYASSGEVVDVSDPAAPRRAGVFAMSGAVLPRPGDRALMVANDGTLGGPLTLHLLDTTTFTALESHPLGDSTVSYEQVTSLVHLDPGILAFLAGDRFGDDSAVYVLDDPELVP
jgi:hypothetical protein